MNYEKKYNEALEVMRQWIAPCHTKEQLDTLKKLVFPELAESEDERILRVISEAVITFFSDYANDFEDEDRDAALAWLEKQKEPLPIPDKFSGLNSLLLQYFQSAVKRNDDTEIESDTDLWGRKILDYVWKHDEKQKEQKPIKVGENAYFDPNTDMWFIKKEQKPAEWSEEDEDMLNSCISSIEEAKENRYAYRETDGDTSYDHEISWLKSLRPQPKQEWSEEDETRRNCCMIYLANARDCIEFNQNIGDNARERGTKAIQEVINWLKFLPKRFNLQPKQEWTEEDKEMFNTLVSYVEDPSCWNLKCPREKLVAFIESLPKRFRPQPKQEWSEEETKDLVHILKVLDDCYAYGKHDLSKTDHDNLTSMIKSLRPSWKPSEEQIKYLLMLADYFESEGGTSNAKTLREFSEDLRKLI